MAKHHLGSTIIISALLMWPFQVISAQPDSGQLMQDIVEIPEKLPEIIDFKTQLPPPLKDEGVKVVLNSIAFKGYVGLLDEAELNRLVDYALGRELGFNGLMYLADRVTEYLRQRGYIIARAYLPQQDITEGNLVIIIQPGRLELVDDQVEGYRPQGEPIIDVKRINETVFYDIDSATDVLHAPKLERGLLIVNDLHGVSVQSKLAPGSQVGTTAITLDVKEGDKFNGAVWLDNYGNLFTGKERLNVLSFLNNPTRRGDQLGIMASLSEGVEYGRLNYQTPIGFSGLTLDTAISQMNYELGEAFKNDGIVGDVMNLSTALRYPLMRSRLKNTYLNAEYDYKVMVDEKVGVEDKHRVFHRLQLGLEGDRQDAFQGHNSYGINLTQGSLDLSGNVGAQVQDQSASGPKTEGGFSKLNLNFSRLQRVTQNMNAAMRLDLQPYASKNLDASEKFNLGGPQSIRAYPSGELTGDLGWRLALELHKKWPTLTVLGADLQTHVFFDAGSVTLDVNAWQGNTALPSEVMLMGAGMGFVLKDGKNYTVTGFYALKMSDKPSERRLSGLDSEGKDTNGRIGLQAMWRF